MTTTPIPLELYVYTRNSNLSVKHLRPVSTNCIRDRSTVFRCNVAKWIVEVKCTIYNKVDTIEQKVSVKSWFEASIGFVLWPNEWIRLSSLLDFVLMANTMWRQPLCETVWIFQMLIHSLLKMQIIWDSNALSTKRSYRKKQSILILWYRSNKSLTEVSEKRLEAIKGFYWVGVWLQNCYARSIDPWAGNILRLLNLVSSIQLDLKCILNC